MLSMSVSRPSGKLAIFKGAILIPSNQIRSRIGAVSHDKSAPIVLYCPAVVQVLLKPSHGIGVCECLEALRRPGRSRD